MLGAISGESFVYLFDERGRVSATEASYAITFMPENCYDETFTHLTIVGKLTDDFGGVSETERSQKANR